MSVNKFGEAWEEQETSIKWRDEMVFKLIALRQKYNNVFSGKRGSARDGWTTIASELGLIEHNYKVLQKKWQNLVQKYKEVKSPANQPSNADGQLTTTWVFYQAMDQVLGDPEVANNTLFDSPRTVRHVQASDGDPSQMMDFDFSDLSLVQDPVEQPFKKKKVSQGYEPQEQTFNTNTQSVQYVDSSEPPEWFRDFLTTYRQDEAKRMEALKSMHYDVMRLERKKCALLQELISKLSADEEDVLSDSPSPSNISKSGSHGQPTSTLTVTMDQSDHFKAESASADSQEPDDDTELSVVRTADDLEHTQIIIKSEQVASIGESLVTFNQSSLGATAQELTSKSFLTSGHGSPVKLLVASHPGSLKGGQPLLIKTTNSRGKLIVPMRKLMVPVSETPSSASLGSAGTVLSDSVIASPGYHCVDTSDSG